jgi:hypothetical protein
MLKIEETLTPNMQLRAVYNNYADMLYGHILEVVKDHKIAETYFLEIFTSISKELCLGNIKEINTWSQLLKYARAALSTFTIATSPRSAQLSLNLLNEEQRKIFSDTYYYGKTVDVLAIELNQPVDFIKRSLREAFIIIRKGSGN